MSRSSLSIRAACLGLATSAGFALPWGVGAAQTLASEGGRQAVTTAAGANGADDSLSPAEVAAAEAGKAAESLRSAIGQLDKALTADDQVIALGDVIRAYEQGQSALRGSLRRAALREAQIRGEFEQRRERLASVVGVMTAMQQSPETLLLLHPSGPAGTAQSGMVLSAVAPALRAEADSLKAGLDEIATVRSIQQSAANTLAQGVAKVQDARRMLASAVTDRSTMPQRFGADPAELTSLLASADTLDSFAEGIAQMEQDIGAPMADFEAAQGSLPLPAVGELLRKRGEPDARGVERPGIVLATAPAALVSSPWPATIRYRGPLLDYGNVMIVEPAQGYLLVLAGLKEVFGATGDVVEAGEPLGIMGGDEGAAAEFGAAFVESAAGGKPMKSSQELYVELRKGKETLDPTEWFVMNPVMGVADGADSDNSAEPEEQVRTTE